MTVYQRWTSLKLGAGSYPFQFFNVVAMVQILEPSSTVLLGHWQGGWIKSRADGTQSDNHMGCQSHRQKIRVIHHYKSPKMISKKVYIKSGRKRYSSLLACIRCQSAWAWTSDFHSTFLLMYTLGHRVNCSSSCVCCHTHGDFYWVPAS